MNNLNTLEKQNTIQQIIDISNRISELERVFQGVPISSVRIESLEADKILTGTLTAIANMGGLGSNSRVRIDGENTRIVISDDDFDRIILGKLPDNNYGLIVSKVGVDVNTATIKQLIFSSQFDTLKVKISGTLTISLPAATFGGSPAFEQIRTYTASLNHALGYIPYFLPRPNDVVAYTNAAVGTGGDYLVNDIEEGYLPILGYGVNVAEFARLGSTSSNLTLTVTRMNTLGTNTTFSARTVTCYYTLFYNKIDQIVSYL